MSGTATRSGLRDFWAGLAPEGRWLLSTVAVQTLGRGLTLPFTVIYLHEVRDIPLDVAGTLMAWIAVVALLVPAPAAPSPTGSAPGPCCCGPPPPSWSAAWCSPSPPPSWWSRSRSP